MPEGRGRGVWASLGVVCNSSFSVVKKSKKWNSDSGAGCGAPASALPTGGGARGGGGRGPYALSSPGLGSQSGQRTCL